MDDVDIGNERAEAYREAKLEEVRKRLAASQTLTATHCVECGDEMPEGRKAMRCVFCQDEFEKAQKKKFR
jgi:hypothetical protein